MNDYIKEIFLDLNCVKNTPVVSVGQFDSGRKLKIHILADGNEFDITGCTAVFKGQKPDYKHFAENCMISDNSVIVTLTDQMLSAKGWCYAKIVLSDSQKTYSTNKLIIDVDGALEGNIESIETYAILNHLLQNVQALNESGGVIVDDEISEASIHPVQNKAIAAALSSKLNNAPGAVTTDNIADKAVSNAKLADGSVTRKKLGNMSVSTEQLSNKAVTEAKIADGAITKDKLADESVTTEKLAYQCVTHEELADGAVTESTLDPELLALIKNIETGISTLNCSYNPDYVKSASCKYTKISNVVILRVDITFFASDASVYGFQFNNLPFANPASGERIIGVTSKGKQVVINSQGGTYLHLMKSVNFVDDETLTFIYTYLV